MKLNIVTIIALAGASCASPLEERQASGGDGPYGPRSYKTESTLAQHTFYLPSKAPSTLKLPVVVWGNGGCSANGISNAAILHQFASYGYLVIASGAPNGQGSTTAQTMTDSINWVAQNAGKGSYANVDATKIMAAGYSCGGVEAYAQIWDSRVDTIGIFSSGLLQNQTAAQYFNKPILYVLGRSSDIAYANGERDFDALPANTPSWKGNINVGHGGTFGDPNGGRYGKAGVNWLEWLFRGNTTAAAYFTSGYQSDGWQVETHALDKLQPLA